MPLFSRLLRTTIKFQSSSRSAPLLFSVFSSLSSTSQNTPTRTPPRKGRQAARRLLKLLSSSDSSDVVLALDALRSSPSAALSSAHAASLISAASNPLLSFDFYRLLKSSSAPFRPESPLFSSLLKCQLQSLSPHRFRIRFYLGEMKKHGIRLPPNAFRSLFAPLFPERSCLARSFLEQLVEVIGIDSETCGQVISVYVEHGLVEEAVGFAAKAKAEVEDHGLEFYSSLMGLYEVTGDAKSAMEVFMEMGERGVAADEEVYRAILRILCKVEWVKLCSVLLEEMMRGPGFRPDESLGLDLMRAFARRDMVSEAHILFREGILKEKDSFLVLAEVMTEKKMPLEVFRMLKDVGGASYCAPLLIHGCGKLGLIEEAEKIFVEIKSLQGMETWGSVYSSMVYVYAKAGLRRSAEMIWEEMEASGCFKTEACLCMMTMYGEMGLLDNVMELSGKWKQSGIRLNVDGYAVLIDTLVKADRLDKARYSLSEMSRFGIHAAGAIYLSMIEGYLKMGLLNYAAALLDEYEMSGFKVENGAGAGSLARILIRLGRYSNLIFHLDLFTKSGVKFSTEMGNSLVKMCSDDLCLRKLSPLIK